MRIGKKMCKTANPPFLKNGENEGVRPQSFLPILRTHPFGALTISSFPFGLRYIRFLRFITSRWIFPDAAPSWEIPPPHTHTHTHADNFEDRHRLTGRFARIGGVRRRRRNLDRRRAALYFLNISISRISIL